MEKIVSLICICISAILLLEVNLSNVYASIKSCKNYYHEIDKYLPNEVKCTGKIVKSLPELKDSVAAINPKIKENNSQINYYNSIKCIDTNLKPEDEGYGFILEKTVFKNGLHLILITPQTYEHGVSEFYFILPVNSSTPKGIRGWYKKTAELLTQIKNSTDVFLDDAIATINKAYYLNFIKTFPMGTKEKLSFGTMFLCPREVMYKTIVIDEPIYIKNKEWVIIKLTYALGPL